MIYNITACVSLFFCIGFFVLFHIYQRKKEFSQHSSSKDDFVLSCIGLTIQMGSIGSAVSVYAILSAWQNQFLTCFLLNSGVLIIQIQLVCMLFFSLTGFANLFFPQHFSRMNHYLIGVLIKIIIIFIPAYLNFVIGHTCGLDSFCPKDFRISYNLITYTEPVELQAQMVSLIMENLDCRTKIGKVVFPTFMAISLLTNLCIVVPCCSLLSNCNTISSIRGCRAENNLRYDGACRDQ